MKDFVETIKVWLEDPRHRKMTIIASISALAILLVIVVATQVRTKRYSSELYIDTVAQPLKLRVSELNLDAPYYNEKVQQKVISFYRQNEYKTKWLEHKKPNANYKAFEEAVKKSAPYGLNPDHYNFDNTTREIDSLYNTKGRTPEAVAAMDIRISASFFLFTTHLIEGRIRNVGYGDYIWKNNAPPTNDIDLLLNNRSGKLSDIIEALHSPHPQYEKLRKALADYRALAEKSPLQIINTNNNTKILIKPGDVNPAIPAIRRRLFLTDIKAYSISDDSLQYDKKLEDGVKSFQARHGLEADGTISDATLKELGKSFKERAALIELNLERLRWLPLTHGGEYISINIPEYMLRVYDDKKIKLEMKVVLGSEYNATPIFRDSLQYIVFSPTWTVPPGIMADEVIPNLQQDAAHYDIERFNILKKGQQIDPVGEDWHATDLSPEDYVLVEKPGVNNSLGLVKFMMPNDLHIYLHDTPAESLFNKRKRTYSHGCIRLEKPLEMAKYLLRDQGNEWNEKAMKEAMQAEEPVNVNLSKKVPVEIEYRTVWVDDKGIIHFREDIYGHDQRQLAALNKLKA